MYDILKNFLLILVAFLAPYWFPKTQKIFNGEPLTSNEWIVLLLIFVAPMLALWWGEKESRKERIKELKEAFKGALRETGIQKALTKR